MYTFVLAVYGIATGSEALLGPQLCRWSSLFFGHLHESAQQ